jgi:hypothetical protein
MPDTISEIQEKIKRRIEENKARAAATVKEEKGVEAESTSLAPIRHPQQDLFLAQFFDAALKDDHASMEHPIFSLSVCHERIFYIGSNYVPQKMRVGPSGSA